MFELWWSSAHILTTVVRFSFFFFFRLVLNLRFFLLPRQMNFSIDIAVEDLRNIVVKARIKYFQVKKISIETNDQISTIIISNFFLVIYKIFKIYVSQTILKYKNFNFFELPINNINKLCLSYNYCITLNNMIKIVDPSEFSKIHNI